MEYVIAAFVAFITAVIHHFYTKNEEELGKTPKEFELIQRKNLTERVREYTFKTRNPNKALNLPCGQHIRIHGIDNSGEIQRSYTPTVYYEPGFFKIVIKYYQGGKMGGYLENKKVGDKVKISGPVGPLTYLGNGRFKQFKKETQVNTMCLVCGGTGITPMYQIANFIHSNPSDKTKVYLIVANSKISDILLSEELKKFESDPRIEIHFTVSRPESDTWKGHVGRVSKELFESVYPKSGKGIIAAYCGPPGFEKSCKKLFTDLGYRMGLSLFRW